jgi:hypothetical protein
MKPKDAWYQLSKEEQQTLVKQDVEVSHRMMEKLGDRSVLACDCFWSTEDWLLFGVEEYPDVESVQESTEALREMGWFKYFESRIILGISEMPFADGGGLIRPGRACLRLASTFGYWCSVHPSHS